MRQKGVGKQSVLRDVLPGSKPTLSVINSHRSPTRTWMTERITGINRSTLWLGWKEVRAALREASIRDVVDFIDYDIEPDVWIKRLLRHVALGSYEPRSPFRFNLSKSRNFKRVLTFPDIPDVVLFRAIADFIHERARKQQQPHVYYRRADLSQATKAAQDAAQQKMDRLAADYRFTSRHSFLNWLNYAQYRKHLILRKTYRFIVVSDITNFFNSVLHSEVSRAFRSLPIPGEMVGLLFFLLERLAIRATYCDSPGIGLPIDEFECSRTVANLILFPHDRRMVRLVGTQAYVRWMDDHVIGVNSEAEGLRVLAAMQDSLASLYLSPNAKKSLVLTLAEAKVHFHLATNADLDALEQKVASKGHKRKSLVRELIRVWRLALQNEGKGQWEQIQSRVYKLAGMTKARFLRRRAISDLLENPTLAERISSYMRCSGSSSEYLRFIKSVISHRQQIHTDVPLLLLESLLRVETPSYSARRILRMAETILNAVMTGQRDELFAAPACLLILRFGSKGDLSKLKPGFQDRRRVSSQRLIRAAAIVYASAGRREFSEVRRAAAALLSSPLGLMVRLVLRILQFSEVPDRYKLRLNTRWDSVQNKPYVDMRMLVSARLLALSRKKNVKQWLKSRVAKMKKEDLSAFDKRLLARLII